MGRKVYADHGSRPRPPEVCRTQPVPCHSEGNIRPHGPFWIRNDRAVERSALGLTHVRFVSLTVSSNIVSCHRREEWARQNSILQRWSLGSILVFLGFGNHAAREGSNIRFLRPTSNWLLESSLAGFCHPKNAAPSEGDRRKLKEHSCWSPPPDVLANDPLELGPRSSKIDKFRHLREPPPPFLTRLRGQGAGWFLRRNPRDTGGRAPATPHPPPGEDLSRAHASLTHKAEQDPSGLLDPAQRESFLDVSGNYAFSRNSLDAPGGFPRGDPRALASRGSP